MKNSIFSSMQSTSSLFSFPDSNSCLPDGESVMPQLLMKMRELEEMLQSEAHEQSALRSRQTELRVILKRKQDTLNELMGKDEEKEEKDWCGTTIHKEDVRRYTQGTNGNQFYSAAQSPRRNSSPTHSTAPTCYPISRFHPQPRPSCQIRRQLCTTIRAAASPLAKMSVEDIWNEGNIRSGRSSRGSYL